MSASRSASAAFTLLEVMVATMIVALLALTLHRFLDSHLTAMQVMTEVDDERTSLEAVLALVETQLLQIPPHQTEALSGRDFKFQGLSNDALTWRCSAGNGLLTTAASGEFFVTLTVQPVTERSTETELGLRRRPVNPDQAVPIELSRGQGREKYDWLPLIRPIAALEVRYFDARVSTWVDAWTDPERRPTLVRIRLWKRATDAPIEALLPIPSATQNR